MPISALTSVANGLVEAQARVNEVGAQVAREGAGDAVSLSQDAIALMEGRNAAKLQADVLAVTDEVQRTVLSTLGK